jgi:hypothetical protein
MVPICMCGKAGWARRHFRGSAGPNKASPLNMELHISARWAWLRRNTRNIVMPVAENKAPMFAHPTKQWSWRLPSPPVCARQVWESSSDLCVVDVVLRPYAPKLCDRSPSS